MNEREAIRRRPWLAGVLSLVLPGLGQLYNCELARAAFLFAAFHVITASAILLLLFMPGKPWNVVLPLVLILGVLGFVIGDAVKRARRRTSDFRLRSYNRWYVYLGVAVGWNMLLLPLAMDFWKASVAETFRVSTSVMEPTLLEGDYVLVNKLSYGLRGAAAALATRSPERGDLVVFVGAEAPEERYVLRVLGVPGDTLITERLLPWSNTAARPDLSSSDELPSETPSKVAEHAEIQPVGLVGSRVGDGSAQVGDAPLVIASEQYFLGGEGAATSPDFPVFGPVPREAILGKVKRVYLSRDPCTGSVRWHRVGLDVR